MTNNSTRVVGEACPPFYTDTEKKVVVTFRVITTALGVIGNALVLVVVVNNAPFHQNAGYRLLANLAIADGLVLCGHIFGVIQFFATAAGHPQPHWYDVYMTGGFCYWFYQAAIFSMAVVVFNRYVAVVHLSKYKDIFSARNVKVLLAVLWILVLFLAVLYFSGQMTVLYYGDYLGTGYDYSNPNSEVLGVIDWVNAYTLTAYATISYAVIIVVAKRQRSKVFNYDTADSNAQSKWKMQRRELRLTIQFGLAVLVYAAMVSSWLSATIVDPSPGLYAFQTISWSLYHAINPVIYFIFSIQMRKCVYKLVDPSSNANGANNAALAVIR